jgi:hypothetical protein
MSKTRPGDARNAAGLTGAGTAGANAILIKAAETKHGPRQNWRQGEYAQVAIQTLYPGQLPRNIDRSKLTADVNDWLNANSNYSTTGLRSVSRGTVIRMYKDLLLRESSRRRSFGSFESKESSFESFESNAQVTLAKHALAS